MATGASTNGEFGLYRWNFGTAVTGPDPHFHKTISESFFILSGTVRLYDGKQGIDANPGDFLYVPPGGLHGFKNESGQIASMLLLFAPGAPREEYFETLVEIGKGKVVTEEERAEFPSGTTTTGSSARVVERAARLDTVCGRWNTQPSWASAYPL